MKVLHKALVGSIYDFPRNTPVDEYCTWLMVKFFDSFEEHEETGCWLWQGYLSSGYGQVSVPNNIFGVRHMSAHRLSYLFHKGPIKEGDHIRHKCDIRDCVNPEHLEIGTAYDNVHDMIERGRSNIVKGTESFHAKLTEEQVVRIRKLYALGNNLGDLERALGFTVSRATIREIVRGDTWKHVGGPTTKEPKRNQTTIPADKKAEALAVYATGKFKQREVDEMFGFTKGTTYRILKNAS